MLIEKREPCRNTNVCKKEKPILSFKHNLLRFVNLLSHLIFLQSNLVSINSAQKNKNKKKTLKKSSTLAVKQWYLLKEQKEFDSFKVCSEVKLKWGSAVTLWNLKADEGGRFLLVTHMMHTTPRGTLKSKLCLCTTAAVVIYAFLPKPQVHTHAH